LRHRNPASLNLIVRRQIDAPVFRRYETRAQSGVLGPIAGVDIAVQALDTLGDRFDLESAGHPALGASFELCSMTTVSAAV